ncbi:MAG TPA: ABC transporter permease [Cytophagaceae bacterium]|jgi:ABC-type multidrug transport system permease subunit|nr:ABC transporter permease [Cytophagaceae bacterium]
MKIKQIAHLVLVNFRNFFREPGALFWSFAFPVAMAWVLGIAFSGSPEKKYKVFLSGDSTFQKIFPSASATGFTQKIGTGSGTSAQVEFLPASEKTLTDALKKGICVLYIDLKNGQPVFHYDPGNSEAVTLYLMLERELSIHANRPVYVTEKITMKGTRYIDFLIPGLLAMGVMNSCVWGISWYLIELRMKKLLRRMVATPMRKSSFIISHFVTRLLLTSFESCILVLFSWLFFGIQMTGSFAALVLIYLSGILAFGGIGLVLASRTQSTHVANGLINAVVLPMTIVSGIFFSYQSFPEWMIAIIKVLPLTLLSDSVRAIFNEGAGLPEVLLPCGVLTGLGVVFYLIGLKIFKWY